MVEPEFLELLMRLLTGLSGFDCGGESLEARIGRKVRHIVFLFARRPALTDEPDLVARHALHAIIKYAVLVAVRHADTAGREEACQPPLCAPPPVDLSPFLVGQQRFGRDRNLIRNVLFARPSGLGEGKDQSDVGGIDVLPARQSHRPLETALAKSLTERPAGAISRVGKDAQ